MKQLQNNNQRFTEKAALLMIAVFLMMTLPSVSYAQEYGEAMKEAEQAVNDLKGSVDEVNNQIGQVAAKYQQFRDCVTGSGDTGRECQRYIDQLYTLPGAGIERHDEVMDLKMTMEELLKRFEASGVYKQLTDAKRTFEFMGERLKEAKTAMEFANKFNPDGARGDPTRGLRLIGSAIGDAAGSLPYPMDEIFKGYAESVTIIAGKLTDLQNKINEARQGNLGGSYSNYAEAQAYFETHFEGQNGRTSIAFFDVTSEFRLLGNGVQVFQNFLDNSMEYYIYEPNNGEKGWIAPPVFRTVYQYFEALPDRSVLPSAFRVTRLVAQARTNPNVRIEQARAHRLLFLEAERDFHSEQLLKEMNLWDSMSSLLTNTQDAFIGFWLLVDEKRSEIQQIVDALTNYVYIQGTVFWGSYGSGEIAPGQTVVLNVQGGGTGRDTSDEQGEFFIYTNGQTDSRYTLTAGQGDEQGELSGRFDGRGFTDVSIYIERDESANEPISITISPAAATLKVGEAQSFTAVAIFEDDSTANVTGMSEWSIGGNTFTATEPGDFPVSATYMGFEASASVTVEEEAETQCNEPSEILDEETGSCVCNKAEGYEPGESGKCVNLDEAIDELTEEGNELCDEEVLTASLARLDELVATGNQMAAGFRANLNKFMKEVNDQNSNPCENNIIAAAYAGAKESLAKYELLVDEATSLSTDLILEAGICPLEEISIDINSILQKISQLGPPLNDIRDGLVLMENQLQTFGCDEQEVADQGDTIAERDDTEVTQAGGTGATEICGDGIDNDGDGLIDEGCEGAGNFNVIIVLYDSGTAADDIFGLSVSGQGNLGTTPEGGSRTYPLRLSPGSYVATVTVISAPDNTGTYTIRILEGDQEIAADTGGPPQGSVITVPFTIGDNAETSAEAESILPRMLNFIRQIEQNEGGDN